MMADSELAEDRYRWLNEEILRLAENDPIRRELAMCRAAVLRYFEFDVRDEFYFALLANAAQKSFQLSLNIHFWQQTHPSLFQDIDAILDRAWASAWYRFDQEHALLGLDIPYCPLSTSDFQAKTLFYGLPDDEWIRSEYSFPEILLKHPIVFRAFWQPDRWSVPFSSGNGIECGPGWWPIIWELADWLELRAREIKLIGASDFEIPIVTQVTEDQGRLCISARVPRQLADEWNARVDKAVANSTWTCPACGRKKLDWLGWEGGACECYWEPRRTRIPRVFSVHD